MTKQETIKPMHASIYAALAAAQMEMGKALKQSSNPHFRSKYADLGNVMDACLPALNKHGIAVVQPVAEVDGARFVKTVLFHETGESIETLVPLIVQKNDMQGLGSAITYARRYGLMCLAGIAPEDDDGNAAAKAAPKTDGHRSWAQTITDELPDNATPHDKAKAVSEALCRQFQRKRTVGELSNEWERREKEIAALKNAYSELFGDVVDAYENRKMAIEGQD